MLGWLDQRENIKSVGVSDKDIMQKKSNNVPYNTKLGNFCSIFNVLFFVEDKVEVLWLTGYQNTRSQGVAGTNINYKSFLLSEQLRRRSEQNDGLRIEKAN